MPIQAEQLTGQGTRTSETPPWESYDTELDSKMSPALQREVDAYSRRKHAKTSTQNEEELCRQREWNAGVAKEYQWLTPEEYRDEEPRIGRVMSHAEFIDKLRAGGPLGAANSDGCGVRCWYRDHTHADKVTLWYGDVWGRMEPAIGCWAQYGYMPEFSFVRFDEHGVPLNERRRGWRTCLLQLILKGVVSESLAHQVFGEARGPAATRYLTILDGFRHSVEVEEI
jgi:hypothetical protein